jgi:hypothetical protein
MDVSPTILPRMSIRGKQPPPQQSGNNDELIKLADELSERENIPIEAAWNIVSRHHSPSVTGGTQNGH